uniref:DUF834 domain-containing protein n=1 Tax=Oryza rufipogon TaxID=4529 RepID=A0A0E0QJM8_ORYRU
MVGWVLCVGARLGDLGEPEAERGEDEDVAGLDAREQAVGVHDAEGEHGQGELLPLHADEELLPLLHATTGAIGANNGKAGGEEDVLEEVWKAWCRREARRWPSSWRGEGVRWRMRRERRSGVSWGRKREREAGGGRRHGGEVAMEGGYEEEVRSSPASGGRVKCGSSSVGVGAGIANGDGLEVSREAGCHHQRTRWGGR